ncbi:DUF3572 domain-containing protein [Novosphingobium sp.]|uniref:DUF3572 domain-containing protein n=1 Tax=Novosphingobium sp. TaxID=1874826 RepID=UPI002FE12A6E
MLRESPSPSQDPQTLALGALGWILKNQDRAERFLALTGLTPGMLRDSLEDPATMAGVLEFLCSHEPDLVAAADALEVSPETLVHALKRLGA